MADRSINAVAVDEGRFDDLWGIKANEYTMIVEGKRTRVDFQDLMVRIAEQRAASVEDEISPLSTRIRLRNTKLENLGKALSKVNGALAQFKSDKTDDTPVVLVSWDNESVDALNHVLHWTTATSAFAAYYHKSQLDELSQLIKSKVDALNNASQTDMTRLQSLVDHRDQAYSTATTLMTSVSDTRGNLIKNL